jgi:hypothetical protein
MIRTKIDEAKYIALCMKQPVLTNVLDGYVRPPLKSLSTPETQRATLRDRLYDEAQIAAAELVGPNSHEYDDVLEAKYEELLTKHGLD